MTPPCRRSDGASCLQKYTASTRLRQPDAAPAAEKRFLKRSGPEGFPPGRHDLVSASTAAAACYSSIAQADSTIASILSSESCPFASKGQVDRNERPVAGRRCRDFGRCQKPSSADDDRTVIQRE